MATDASLRGVYIPIITPFSGDGSVATDALERLCHEYLDAGAAGIVALGTTGESTARRQALALSWARGSDDLPTDLVNG